MIIVYIATILAAGKFRILYHPQSPADDSNYQLHVIHPHKKLE